MPAWTKTITYALVASSSTGIAISQAGISGTPISFNGGLVSGGVATLDSGGASRRVSIFSGGNDSGISFRITGTNYAGATQSETLGGGNGAAAQSVFDYKTVTSIVPTGNTATYLQAGTNGVGSSPPVVLDWIANPNGIRAGTLVTGTVNYTVQEALDDFSPAWDLTRNTPNWFPDSTFNASTTTQTGIIVGPFTLLRVLINSGTGTVQTKLVTPFIGGAI